MSDSVLKKGKLKVLQCVLVSKINKTGPLLMIIHKPRRVALSGVTQVSFSLLFNSDVSDMSN